MVGDLGGERWDDDPDPTPVAKEAADVADVEVGGTEVLICVNTHNGVEETVGERKCMCLGVDGCDQILDPGLADAAGVRGRIDPQNPSPIPGPRIPWPGRSG